MGYIFYGQSSKHHFGKHHPDSLNKDSDIHIKRYYVVIGNQVFQQCVGIPMAQRVLNY